MDFQQLSEQLAVFSSDYKTLLSLPWWILILIVLTAIWKFTWYGIALYKSSKSHQKLWFIILFVLMFILNDLGLLPILYLIFNRKKPENHEKLKENQKKLNQETKRKSISKKKKY